MLMVIILMSMFLKKLSTNIVVISKQFDLFHIYKQIVSQLYIDISMNILLLFIPVSSFVTAKFYLIETEGILYSLSFSDQTGCNTFRSSCGE